MATKKYLGIGFAVAGVSVLGVVLHIRRKRRSELHTFGSMLRQYFEFIILKVFGAQMMKKLESESINFEDVQERTLLSILKSNADTEYGMQYMFRDIQSKEQYLVKHPLTRYSHYKDYVGEILRHGSHGYTHQP